MTDKPATYSGVAGAGINRSGWHRQKKEVRALAEGEDVFTIAEVESLGFKGVKKFALTFGLLKEGRYRIAGRAKIKRMNYVDRAGLVAILEHFRAKQGLVEVVKLEAQLEGWARRREKRLGK